MSDNCVYYQNDILDFIEEHLNEFDLDETFAICSFVGSEPIDAVKSNFKNIFTFYPSHKSDLFIYNAKNKMEIK